MIYGDDEVKTVFYAFSALQYLSLLLPLEKEKSFWFLSFENERPREREMGQYSLDRSDYGTGLLIRFDFQFGSV